VIPAYNEALSIGNVIANCKAFCDEIIIVDDGSADDTSEIAKKNGAVAIRNEKTLGVTKATQKGLEAASGDIIVTMDADGQHDPNACMHYELDLAEIRFNIMEIVKNEDEQIVHNLITQACGQQDT